MSGRITFSEPVAELVRRRRSCRSFADRAVEPEMLADLERFASGLTPPFAGRLRFAVIDNERVRAENLFSAGSYGLIKGARFYLAAVARRDEPRRWEDIGFALEAAVLHATGLGLATCWIGGVFDRRRFGRALEIRGSEQLPAVVALGRPAEKRTLRDRLVRWSAKGDRRKSAAELFFKDDWRTPLSCDQAGEWAQVLECVRLGPSASNKQPWRIIRCGSSFHFFLDRDRAYSAMMPLADLQRIDMGIAMCHFESAVAETGSAGGWFDDAPEIPATPSNYEYVVSFAVR